MGEPVLSHQRSPQCHIDIPDVPAETAYDALHDVEYRWKWDTNVIDVHDITRLVANADVGYCACEWGPEARGGQGMELALFHRSLGLC